jgi:4-hydroxy-tetrahydrodipicolinate reductase
VVAAAVRDGWRVTLTVTPDLWRELERPDVVVDASRCSVVPSVAAYCVRSGCALLEAVSGLDRHAEQALREAARAVPVVLAPNLSYGHYLQTRAAALATSAICDRAWDVVVTDRHPVTKRDRPSATARELQQVCLSGGVTNASIETIRSGPPVSDHHVTLIGDGETIVFTHAVTDLRAAVSGALHAARWLLTAAPGMWSMRDVWAPARTSVTDGRQICTAIVEEQP